MKGFEQVKVDRERRRELAYTKIPRTRTAATRLLDKIAEEAWTRGDLGPAALASQANGKLLESLVDAQTYLHSPDSRRVTHALQMLSESRQLLDELADTVTDPILSARVARTQDLLLRYERSMLRMVQTTRGYLHLVNVVMAGEAAEFVRSADSFKQQTLDDLNLLADRMATEGQRFKLISDCRVAGHHSSGHSRRLAHRAERGAAAERDHPHADPAGPGRDGDGSSRAEPQRRNRRDGGGRRRVPGERPTRRATCSPPRGRWAKSCATKTKRWSVSPTPCRTT